MSLASCKRGTHTYTHWNWHSGSPAHLYESGTNSALRETTVFSSGPQNCNWHPEIVTHTRTHTHARTHTHTHTDTHTHTHTQTHVLSINYGLIATTHTASHAFTNTYRHTHASTPTISWLTVFSLWTNIQPWAIIKYYSLLSTSLSLALFFLLSLSSPLSQFCSALLPLLLLSLAPLVFYLSFPPSPPRVCGCSGRLSPLFPVKQIKMAAVWMGLLSATTFTSKKHSHTHTPSRAT